MVRARHIVALFLAVTLVVTTLTALSAPSDWEELAAGISYQEFHLPDPNNVYVARLDIHNPSAIIESSIGQGRLSGGVEKVTDMARRYDQAINYWGQTWGGRNDVVVAINGSYYNNEGPGIPDGGQIHSGWYAKRFNDYGGFSGFAWYLNRNVMIGDCVYHEDGKQFITFIPTGDRIEFQGINISRPNNTLILYTPQYDATTKTSANDSLEVLVEMEQPTMVLTQNEMVTGYIREIRDGQGSTPIPFDHIILSARGTKRAELLARLAGLQVGDPIGVSQVITHKSECSGSTLKSWQRTYASIQGHFVFLKDGVVQDYNTNPGAIVRDPRTAIAFNEDYVYFIVVDGRAPGVSEGMTIHELAVFAQSQLGATWGVAEDGGGSSVMVVNGAVRNRPSDPCYKVFIPFTSNENPGSGQRRQVNPPPQLGTAQPTWCERPVANGMMMVVVQPISKSTTFTPGDDVITSQPVQVRLGPGTNYAALSTVSQGTPGVILDHMNQLDGVLAKGAYWWKVQFGSVVGWAPESSLQSSSRRSAISIPLDN
jgi:hypothetical protein